VRADGWKTLTARFSPKGLAMLLRLMRTIVSRLRERRCRARKVAFLERALAELPAPQRLAYQLRCIDRLTTCDAATLLDVDQAMLEHDLADALVALAGALEEQ
jgi:hypothetical protein